VHCSRHRRHACCSAHGRHRLGRVLQATGLTRPPSGRAKAGFASFVPPLKSNVRAHMSTSHGAEVELQFRTADDGGRTEAVSLGHGTYRPHFVVSQGEYLGVVVVQAPVEPVQPGGKVRVTVAFVYEPAVNYSALVQGALFEVMEGARVVAIGRVLRLV